jgi:hypothetical protein
MFGFVHVQDMHNYSVDDLFLTISLEVEGDGFGNIGVQQSPEVGPECVENLLSRYDIIVCGIPKCTHNHLKKNLEKASTVIFFLRDVRMDILET